MVTEKQSATLFDLSERLRRKLPLIEVEECDVEEITLDAGDVCRELLEG
jgi:hypothetical protein